jgi:hypothetical protein
VRVLIHGELPDAFAPTLRALDARGVCELRGAFATDELERLLAGVDVAVLPSMWWDCAPLAAAECLAARVPLVVPRLGGLAEAVRDGVDGLVVDALDADALALALDRLAGERGLLERLQGGIEAPRAFADYVDELEAYYAGEGPGRVAAESESEADEAAVLCEGASVLDLPAAAPRAGAPRSRPRVRIQRLGSADPPLPHAAEPWPLSERVALRALATPAWRGSDRLATLLAQWCTATTPATSACLYLLADPAIDGAPETIERGVLAACEASGADLDAAADVTVLLEAASAERDARLHMATDAYVPLHRACAGHERIALTTGSSILPLDGRALATALARAGEVPAATPA